MESIRVVGKVDEHGCLVAQVPAAVAPGEVDVVVSPRTAVENVDDVWMAAIARQWHDDLHDPAQDIYTLADGVPTDESR